MISFASHRGRQLRPDEAQHDQCPLAHEERPAPRRRLVPPGHRRSGYNTNDGGQGAYFDSPEGHNLEILTRPYGSGS